MHALFVHGMGRTPVSGWPLLWKLRRAGIKTLTFGYFASAESFSHIRERLVLRIVALAAKDEYTLIGHSLGGVLLRDAVNNLPAGIRPPRRVFMLGSPIQASRLAQRLRGNPVFRLLTRDCGLLLGSAARMAAIGHMSAPTTSIVGTRGLAMTRGPFRGEPNDGLVAVAEASAAWITEQIQIPSVHTLLPTNGRVAQLILERLGVGDYVAFRRQP